MNINIVSVSYIQNAINEDLKQIETYREQCLNHANKATFNQGIGRWSKIIGGVVLSVLSVSCISFAITLRNNQLKIGGSIAGMLGIMVGTSLVTAEQSVNPEKTRQRAIELRNLAENFQDLIHKTTIDLGAIGFDLQQSLNPVIPSLNDESIKSFIMELQELVKNNLNHKKEANNKIKDGITKIVENSNFKEEEKIKKLIGLFDLVNTIQVNDLDLINNQIDDKIKKIDFISVVSLPNNQEYEDVIRIQNFLQNQKNKLMNQAHDKGVFI
jgi:hypothetical protein